jgi:hypothetical protein
MSVSYGVNGVEFLLQPESGRWDAKNDLGFDGNGHPIYPAVGEFTLSWGLVSPAEFEQMNNFYISSSTGTVVTDLPKWGGTPYQFYSYSGTIVQRPEVGEYFMGYMKDVKLVVSRIRV